ncbi:MULTISPECIES: GFA family protein [unclassified Paraburkholderia]|uniref:GFA family protein n=1 Tax=unclassified Paraburkholderia TaxID=2615204 RepID=UPI0016120CF6|nr:MULTISPECIES: GFA family protein [unclassified Paraburkholderia]MBB5448053.1 ADP-ribosyl-[dinitrogen reductase] hydrolase [Paraburkholderia sp. WSM4177]MBB5488468.1 ADP-ribosyl-[dinitrogen reductase] hydrolase [Paraburkholderia sp. WSM4180]
MSFKGSCLCGSVRYEIEHLDSPIEHCHCVTCRKAHAAAFATTARVSRERFRWTAGKHLLRAFESSPGKLRHFCSVCGSHLIAERPIHAHILLRVPTLDDNPGQQPVVHIWTSHDSPWLLDADEAPHYPEWPPGL